MRQNFPDEIRRRVTGKAKERKKYKRQRDLAHYYDRFHGDYRDYAFLKKCHVNYDLFNGRLDVSLYEAPVTFKVEEETVTLDHNEIVHFPFISQVANAMLGEQIARPFRPTAVATGPIAKTARSKKYNELIRDYLIREVVRPIQLKVQAQYFSAAGIQDPFSLSSEDQVQAQQAIQQQVEASTPAIIMEFMQNDFQTPTERQHQQLLNYLNDNLNLQDLQNEGFKHAIITGREVYYIGDRNGEPVIELVNPMYFQWSGGQNEEWVQNGEWAKTEEWLTFGEAASKFGEHFSRSDWKKLEEYAEPIRS